MYGSLFDVWKRCWGDGGCSVCGETATRVCELAGSFCVCGMPLCGSSACERNHEIIFGHTGEFEEERARLGLFCPGYWREAVDVEGREFRWDWDANAGEARWTPTGKTRSADDVAYAKKYTANPLFWLDEK